MVLWSFSDWWFSGSFNKCRECGSRYLVSRFWFSLTTLLFMLLIPMQTKIRFCNLCGRVKFYSRLPQAQSFFFRLRLLIFLLMKRINVKALSAGEWQWERTIEKVQFNHDFYCLRAKRVKKSIFGLTLVAKKSFFSGGWNLSMMSTRPTADLAFKDIVLMIRCCCYCCYVNEICYGATRTNRERHTERALCRARSFSCFANQPQKKMKETISKRQTSKPMNSVT